MERVIDVDVISIPPEEIVTKLYIEIDISNLLEDLKIFDALFNIELVIKDTQEHYQYSFIRRDIGEPIMKLPLFVRGNIEDSSNITYESQIRLISKI